MPQLVGLPGKELGNLAEAFNFFVDGYRWMPAFQLGRWDGKIGYIDKRGNTYVKILDEILEKLIEMGKGDEIEIEDLRVPAKPITDRCTADIFQTRGMWEHTLRPYQVEAVNKMLDNGGGILSAATSAGKTLICSALSQILIENNLKVIVIVPSADLIDQTKETMEMVSMDVRRIFTEI
jgi:hypothetical protein